MTGRGCIKKGSVSTGCLSHECHPSLSLGKSPQKQNSKRDVVAVPSVEHGAHLSFWSIAGGVWLADERISTVRVLGSICNFYLRSCLSEVCVFLTWTFE